MVKQYVQINMVCITHALKLCAEHSIPSNDLVSLALMN